MESKHFFRKPKENIAIKFAQTIVQLANQEGIKIRELERACELAILHCREALVPTLQYPKTNQEN